MTQQGDSNNLPRWREQRVVVEESKLQQMKAITTVWRESAAFSQQPRQGMKTGFGEERSPDSSDYSGSGSESLEKHH